MWWSRFRPMPPLLLAMLLLAPVPAAAQDAPPSVCPARPGDIVQAIDVFDGPPEELAYLMADGQRGGASLFTIGPIREAGRRVTIRCKYRSGAALDVLVRAEAEQCAARRQNSGNVLVTCR